MSVSTSAIQPSRVESSEASREHQHTRTPNTSIIEISKLSTRSANDTLCPPIRTQVESVGRPTHQPLKYPSSRHAARTTLPPTDSNASRICWRWLYPCSVQTLPSRRNVCMAWRPQISCTMMCGAYGVLNLTPKSRPVTESQASMKRASLWPGQLSRTNVEQSFGNGFMYGICAMRIRADTMRIRA